MAIFTLYMYSIRKVIMYNCHLDTQPGDLGPFKGCYSVTSTERSFSPRSKKRLETSKHLLNGGSGIFLLELIGINRGMIEKVGQKLSPKIKQVRYRRSKCRWIIRSPVSAIQIFRSIVAVSTFFSPLSFFPDFYLDFFPDFFLDFFSDFSPWLWSKSADI